MPHMEHGLIVVGLMSLVYSLIAKGSTAAQVAAILFVINTRWELCTTPIIAGLICAFSAIHAALADARDHAREHVLDVRAAVVKPDPRPLRHGPAGHPAPQGL